MSKFGSFWFKKCKFLLFGYTISFYFMSNLIKFSDSYKVLIFSFISYSNDFLQYGHFSIYIYLQFYKQLVQIPYPHSLWIKNYSYFVKQIEHSLFSFILCISREIFFIKNLINLRKKTENFSFDMIFNERNKFQYNYS